jgi:hypothetical protein
MDWVGSLPSLLDGLLDGHVYPVPVVRWVQINQKLVLTQTPFRQWAPNETSQTSSSECLFSEGKPQVRRKDDDSTTGL